MGYKSVSAEVKFDTMAYKKQGRGEWYEFNRGSNEKSTLMNASIFPSPVLRHKAELSSPFLLMPPPFRYHFRKRIRGRRAVRGRNDT